MSDNVQLSDIGPNPLRNRQAMTADTPHSPQSQASALPAPPPQAPVHLERLAETARD
jgi:hypothetical protein